MTERWSACKSCKGLGFWPRKLDRPHANTNVVIEAVECDECHGTGHGGRAEDCPWIKSDEEEKLDIEQQRSLHV